MTWNSRLAVVEALERAGWTGDTERPLEILRHPTGAVWAVANDLGDCGVTTPGGGSVDLPGDVADLVVIAAALAASGQLVPEVTVVCDAEGHAVPHTAACPAGVQVGEYLCCGAELGRVSAPFTCERRIGHDDQCSPTPDCRHESWDVTGEYRSPAGWVKSRRCNDCAAELPAITEPGSHFHAETADEPVAAVEDPDAAADPAAWAAQLDADGLQPDGHSLTWAAGEQPIVRVHFAFHKDMHDEARGYLVQAVGEALGREMTAAAF
ncbi:hypothetical protein HUT18_11855 [Streptomyces sp. NA04227]|uniref:hypothetical protein n=1 Tax=Streptomyces sp. NA04227 TaxID=2742136 RepID=UPI001591EC63|nr:hypothetical protein [Streptomyces sp. NA04227]QKW04962.1 hypothetical protein HUT18_11855 [Streptomyces sp. NA04227]